MNKREFYNHKRSFLFLICFNQIEIISLNGDIILKMIMMMTMMTKKMMMRKRMIMNQNRDVVR